MTTRAADAFVIGIDIGGSKTKIGLVDVRNGAVTEQQVIDTPTRQQTGLPFVGMLGALAKELKARADGTGLTVSKVGVGVCELVEQSGRIVSAHRVEVDSTQIIAAFAGFSRIAIESDVRAAAMAEARFGHGKDLSHWVYVNAGTGISSVIMKGQYCHKGEHGWSVCLGMSPVNLLGETPTFIEDIAGANALVRSAVEQGLDVATVGDLFDRFLSGSKDAHDVLEYGGRVLGKAIAMVVNITDPKEIIVGGGLVRLNTPYWKGLVEALKAFVWYPSAKNIPVKIAALQDRAGIVGAALAEC